MTAWNGAPAIVSRRRVLAGGVAALVWALLVGRQTADAEPQPPLPTGPLVIETQAGPVRFAVELAATAAARTRGLQHRSHLADNAGMLFDFETPQPVAMWMKDTYVPLDMLFIDNDGRITRVVEDTLPMSLTVIRSGGPARAVLELVAGTARLYGIRPGDRVRHSIFGNGPAD